MSIKNHIGFSPEKTPINFLYKPGSGPFYKLHPFTKFIFVLIVSFTIVFLDSLILLSFSILCLVLLAKINKIPFKNNFKFIKMAVVFFILIIPLDGIFNFRSETESPVLFYLIPLDLNFPIHLPVRRHVVYYSMKSILWMSNFALSSALFNYTTHPRDFITGLMEARIPYSTAYIIQIAFRYIPILQRDANTISVAQKIRGRTIRNVKGIRDMVEYLKEKISTMLIVAFRHAFHTSISMEKRAFRLYKSRTKIHKIGFKKQDYLFILSTILVQSFLIIYNYTALFSTLPMIPSIFSIFQEIRSAFG
ncbi:MAG: energy-coupling factor transporter transmembrane component T family protein [Promethearchaeota archaeon]